MRLLAFTRKILGKRPLTVTREEAMRAAEKSVRTPLEWPVRVTEGLTTYLVETGVEEVPPGPWFVIDGYTGSVLESGQPAADLRRRR